MMLTAIETKQRWELTAQSFDKLLASFDGTDRRAASERYLQIRKNLVRFFEVRGFFDAETHADEVFNRVARKIDLGESFENVGSYVYGVARFFILELRKKSVSETNYSIRQTNQVYLPKMIEEDETSAKLDCLDKCLGELSDENRQLIINYYTGEKHEKIKNRRKLAESLGIPQNALRNRAVRLREKLESRITEHLRKIGNGDVLSRRTAVKKVTSRSDFDLNENKNRLNGKRVCSTKTQEIKDNLMQSNSSNNCS